MTSRSQGQGVKCVFFDVSIDAHVRVRVSKIRDVIRGRPLTFFGFSRLFLPTMMLNPGSSLCFGKTTFVIFSLADMKYCFLMIITAPIETAFYYQLSNLQNTVNCLQQPMYFTDSPRRRKNKSFFQYYSSKKKSCTFFFQKLKLAMKSHI